MEATKEQLDAMYKAVMLIKEGISKACFECGGGDGDSGLALRKSILMAFSLLQEQFQFTGTHQALCTALWIAYDEEDPKDLVYNVVPPDSLRGAYIDTLAQVFQSLALMDVVIDLEDENKKTTNINKLTKMATAIAVDGENASYCESSERLLELMDKD